MRSSNMQVPRQLHTVAMRYRHDLAGDTAGRGAPNWSREMEAPAALPSHERPLAERRDERLLRLEAILFLSREPLSSRRLSQYANLADATEARTLVRHLNEVLDASGRAFRVEEVACGFQLLTRPKFATWLRRLASVPKELRLSAPALETLSVIAYRQPAGRAEIEAVRGVNCGEIVRQLLERDLVRLAGRSDDLGRPYLYATTRRFLQLFGLRSLDDLPRAVQLRKQNSTQIASRRSTDTTENRNITDSPDRNEEDYEVTANIRAELSPEELRKTRQGGIPGVLPRASDDEEFDEEVSDDEAKDDEAKDDEVKDDEVKVGENDLDELDDDEEFDDDDDDDDDDEFDEVDDEEGFEEEEWEEVDDEDDDLEDDEDDDDWDDDDEEEEEEDTGASWE